MLIAALLALFLCASTPPPELNPAPGQAVSITAAKSVAKLAAGQTYGRITIRPSVEAVVERVGDGPRPIVTDPVQLLDTYGGTGNLTFRGLHFKGTDLNRSIGVVIMDAVDRVVFEDCIFEGCAVGLTINCTTPPAASRVLLSGCVFRGNGACGAFISNASGVLIDGCTFAFNGWGDGAITGRPPNQSHGIYIIGSFNVTTRDSLFAGNRMNAMRGCGQTVDRCVFIDNACAIAAGLDAERISRNVILWGRDFDPDNGGRWGVGIDLNGGFNTVIEQNLIAHNRGTWNIAAISAHGRYFGVKVLNNTVVGWDYGPGNGTAYNLGFDGYGTNYIDGGVTCQLRGGVAVHGDGQEHWIMRHNRVLGTGGIVDPTADPIKYAEQVLGKPGLTPAEAVGAIVEDAIRDRFSIGRVAAWHRERLKAK